MPWAPTLETAEAQSEIAIALTWTPPNDPDDDTGTPPVPPGAAGSEPAGYGKVLSYMVESSPDGTNWSNLVKVGPKDELIYVWDGAKLTTKAGTSADNIIDFEHIELQQSQTVYYRVTTINNASGNQAYSNPSNAKNATTEGSLSSDDPGGLVVKARSSSSLMLMWNARADDIVAAPVSGYKIESSPLDASGDCAATWTTLVADTMNTMTSYTHMGLSPDTGMCYRVFGINIVATSTSFVGFGDSYVTTNDNDAIATTDEAAPNAAPMAVGTIAPVSVTMGQTTAAMDVSSYFSDADMGDPLTYTAMSDMEMYATADIPADSSMLTITGVAAGTATITVTATDSMGAMATQEIMVTVEAAEPEEVGPATGVTTGPFNVGGVIQVNWGAAPNATGYIIYAVNVDELDDANGQIVVAAENDGTADTFNLSGLNVGDTYDIYVVATVKEMVAWPTSADVVQVEAE